MISDQIVEGIEQLRAIWKHRWAGVIAAWAIGLAAWAGALLIPDQYESSARVYVDTRTPLRPVIRGLGVEDDVSSEVDLVRQALLGRPQLEKVARATDLDVGVRSAGDMDDLIDGLRDDVKITMSASDTAKPGENTLYTIVYRHGNREKSLAVVRTLLDTFVEDTLGSKRSGSEVAQTFLRGQIRDYEQRLAASEAALAEFKKRNVGMIPSDRGDYFSRLNTEISGLQQKQTDLAIALSRQAQLRRQLASSRPYIAGSASGLGGSSSGGGGSDISTRRQEAEAKLEELLLKFTDKYPEVVALRQTIADLKVREQRELQDIARGGTGSGAIRSLNANPVYQNIQLQLNQVEVDIASLRGATAQHQREITELKRVVDTAPEVERELARLTRDYGVTKQQYEGLLQRFEQTKVSDDAQQTGIVRFEVIDPPMSKVGPVWPNRPLLILGGLVLALLGGLAVAFAMNMLVPTFNSVRTLASVTGVAVLGAISSFWPEQEVAAQVKDRRRLIAACLGLVGICALMLIFGDAGARFIQRVVA